MYHKNRPVSINEIREVTRDYVVYFEMEINFVKFEGRLIKALFEKLNIDFKRPIPSTLRNQYFFYSYRQIFKISLCFSMCLVFYLVCTQFLIASKVKLLLILIINSCFIYQQKL